MAPSLISFHARFWGEKRRGCRRYKSPAAQKEESSTATKITADFSSAEDIENFRKKLTDKNLSAFRYIKDDTGEIIGEYKNYTFETVSYLYSEEKSVFESSFNIRQLSNIEVRIAAVEAWQTTQNDAIAEMSEVIYSE